MLAALCHLSIEPFADKGKEALRPRFFQPRPVTTTSQFVVLKPNEITCKGRVNEAARMGIKGSVHHQEGTLMDANTAG